MPPAAAGALGLGPGLPSTGDTRTLSHLRGWTRGSLSTIRPHPRAAEHGERRGSRCGWLLNPLFSVSFQGPRLVLKCPSGLSRLVAGARLLK